MNKIQIIRMFIAVILLVMVVNCQQVMAQSSAVSKPQTYYIFKNPSPSEYITMFVTDSVAKWQQKGKFEKTTDYQARVTENTRKQLADRLSKLAAKQFLADYKNKKLSSLKVVLKGYDADNETWLFESAEFGQLVVPVPLAEAEQFEKSWALNKGKTEFYIDGETVKLKKMAFTSQGKNYWYDNSQQATFASTNININFDPLDIDVPSSGSEGNNQTITQKEVKVGTQKSDVDINIPVTGFKNETTFAVIIANENYQKESKVPFALNDGNVFAEYCQKTLGLPQNNIHVVEDATLNNLIYEVDWLKTIIDSYSGEAKVIFYYAGHGIPDEAQKTAYLLPVDGYGSNVKTAFKLDDLYSMLGSKPSQLVTVILDACFSGAKREGDMLASARGIAIKVKQGSPVGNMVVFSAAQGDETAFPHNEKGHGMFTYFLLKKLQETKGDVSFGVLGDYITTQVSRQSIVINGKSQTPTVVPATQLGETWKNWKLK